jgi:hypothetical protein
MGGRPGPGFAGVTPPSHASWRGGAEVERRTPEVSRGRINGGDPSGVEAVYGHRRGPEGLMQAKGAVQWEEQRAGYQTMEDQAYMGEVSTIRGIRSAGRAPATRGGDAGQGGRALGVSTPRTACVLRDVTDRRPVRPHWHPCARSRWMGSPRPVARLSERLSDGIRPPFLRPETGNTRERHEPPVVECARPYPAHR